MSRLMQRITAVLLSLVLLFAAVPHAAAEELCGWYGDVDNDGVLTTADARTILQSTIGIVSLADEAKADMDADARITTADAREVLIAVILKISPTQYVPLYLTAASYAGEPYAVLADNVPRFTDEEKAVTASFEKYAPLDELGRCGQAYANLSQELMPDEERESISSVTPTGWHNQRYDIVSGGWLYNRAHIIGFQLAGEQANALNLITGTRYFNVEGMLPFENMVADYILETGNHVLYRVTPIFCGDNLLAEGVVMEAWSLEDGGDGICFYVFCYNVQPGITLDYATGENRLAGEEDPDEEPVVTVTFILNTSSKKFHLITCRYADSMSAENRLEFGGTREELLADGYTACGTCKP